MTEIVVKTLPLLVCVVAFIASCILVGRTANREFKDRERAAKQRERVLRHRYAKRLCRMRCHYYRERIWRGTPMRV